MIVLVLGIVIENEQNSHDEGSVVVEKSDFVGSFADSLLGRSSRTRTAEKGQLARKPTTGLCLVEIIRNFDWRLDLNANADEDLLSFSSNPSSWLIWIQLHLFLLQRSVSMIKIQML